ncbi:MAG: prepilin peptidase, partial [Coriobacteriaceae bacterium]|nr:prepilin peptidase [Coriobacteriaceae bacterium]
MATVEVLLAPILSALLSGTSPFLAQVILRDRYRKKSRWEKRGLESLAIDQTSSESLHFLEYIHWAIPLRAVSRELVGSARTYISLAQQSNIPTSELTQITLITLPTTLGIKQQYELSSVLYLPMLTLAVICALCGSTIVMIAVGMGCEVFALVILAILLAACIVMVLTDLAARLIPNCITFFLIFCGIALQMADFTSMFSIGLSIVCGLVFWSTCLIMNKVMNRSVIGGGDSKALFSLPLVTGIAGLLPALLVMLASLTGSLFLGIARSGRKAFGKRIPLAPYIAVA